MRTHGFGRRRYRSGRKIEPWGTAHECRGNCARLAQFVSIDFGIERVLPLREPVAQPAARVLAKLR